MAEYERHSRCSGVERHASRRTPMHDLTFPACCRSATDIGAALRRDRGVMGSAAATSPGSYDRKSCIPCLRMVEMTARERRTVVVRSAKAAYDERHQIRLVTTSAAPR
jgi:hypothetical protein